MHFLNEYSLFFAKIITLVAAILVLASGLISLSTKEKAKKGKLKIRKLNKKYKEMAMTLNHATLPKKEYKKLLKKEKEAEKAKIKSSSKRIFVLHFHGDIKASAVQSLREEVTAILLTASTKDEVVICLESAGGMVHSYGLAAAQLKRIRDNKISLTVCVDKVAASGGYMMACVAKHIVAAPFAIIGSVGVIAQLPNFNRFLKKHDIEYEQHTAGDYKRTLTLFGENTDKAREKFREEVEEVHSLFKNFIKDNRPQVNIEKIATGEHWLAKQAYQLDLVDDLITSDDYLLNAAKKADIFQVNYICKKPLLEKLTTATESFKNQMVSFIT